MYDNLTMPEPDALHGVMAKFAADTRRDKIDLGVGVYRELDGRSPIMESVRLASGRLAQTEQTKSYLPLQGHPGFISGMQRLIGEPSSFDRTAKIQTVGGTGGIRLALELAKLSNPDLCVHIGTPTWPNHIAISQSLGLDVNLFEYFDRASQSPQPECVKAAIAAAKTGDVMIFHGPCHNPTGADLCVRDYWDLLQSAEAKGVVPLIDAAYYGLGNSLEDDLERLKMTIDGFSTGFVILSCSKAFGLYRERTGILFAVTPSSKTAPVAQAHLEMIGRKMYSMAPAHGASIVSEILSDNQLRSSWIFELERMRKRVAHARCELAKFSQGMEQLECVPMQKGIFSLLPIDASQVDRMAKSHAIYMPSSGRINVAGLKSGDARRFCDALVETLMPA